VSACETLSGAWVYGPSTPEATHHSGQLIHRKALSCLWTSKEVRKWIRFLGNGYHRIVALRKRLPLPACCCDLFFPGMYSVGNSAGRPWTRNPAWRPWRWLLLVEKATESSTPIRGVSSVFKWSVAYTSFTEGIWE